MRRAAAGCTAKWRCGGLAKVTGRRKPVAAAAVCAALRASAHRKYKSSCRAAHKAWVPDALCRCRLRRTGPPPALPARHHLPPRLSFYSLKPHLYCLVDLFLLQGRYVTVLQHDGKLYCLDSVCFHAGGPLGLGDIEELPGGHSCLKCPW